MTTPRARFATLVDAPECDLARCALEIARIAYPELDPAPSLRTLDALADAVRPRLPRQLDPVHAVGVIAQYLFEECRFRGNADDYYDPRNSYLNEVLARRLGIPITLAVVMIEVGARLGVHLDGVGFPGHFLVGVTSGSRRVLLDPFLGGRPIGEPELLERLRTVAGRARGPKVEHVPPELLEPSDTLGILARMLRNLVRVYESRSEPVPALAALDLLLVLTPDDANEVRARGLLYERLECFGAAADDFRRYLELAALAPEADDVRKRLVRITQSGPTLH